jgi:NlpC/P60 family putative phage cell wall peptidase
MSDGMSGQARIVAVARSWIGTPYRHQASCKGAGADCLGLVRGVWRELMGREPEMPPPYTPDWAERPGGGVIAETMAEGARRHLIEIDLAAAAMGDVVLFRMRTGGPAKHAAILNGEGGMIHAYSGRAVVETDLSRWWAMKLAFAFRFPGPK